MRALAAWVLVVVSFAGVSRAGRAARQTDGVADLLTRLERALTTNDVAAFRALTSPREAGADGDALVRIVQTGPVFDVPVTLTIAYADGPAGSVTLPIHDAVTERRIPLTGRVKGGGIRLVPVL